MVVEPPFDLFVLSTMPEINSELGPCVDAMEKNIDGFGHRIIPMVKIEAEGVTEEQKKAVVGEFTKLTNFFLYAGLDDSFRLLRMKTRRDLETTGNGYWEVVRGATGEIQYFVHVKAYQVRLTAQELEPYEFDMPIKELQEDGSLKIIKIKRRKRFRRFAQVASMIGMVQRVRRSKRVL
jgi:capsid portal protein